MRLYLEIISGPAKGQKFHFKRSISLGRKGTDVAIDDGKLSQIHAFFKFNRPNEWVLLDNNSRNGLWVNGIREAKIKVTDGMEVLVGESIIRCRLIEKVSSKTSESFLDWIRGLRLRVKNHELELFEVKPEIRIRVVEGQQTGKIWEIFYGPRYAGYNHEDLCLYDEGAPKDAFEIRVQEGRPLFYTNHPTQVFLNKQSMREQRLAPGDIIQVGESKILVEFNDGHGFRS